MNFADGQRLLSLIGDPVGFENKLVSFVLFYSLVP